jgi:hypothetical protein
VDDGISGKRGGRLSIDAMRARISAFVEKDVAKGVLMRKLVVLACVLSLLVVVIVLVGCGGGGGSSAQSPEAMVRTFWAAMVKGDFVTAWNLASAKYQKEATASKFAAGMKDFMTTNVPSGTKITYGKASVNGNKGTITVTFDAGGTTHALHMPIVKENGVWKVDMAKAVTP